VNHLANSSSTTTLPTNALLNVLRISLYSYLWLTSSLGIQCSAEYYTMQYKMKPFVVQGTNCRLRWPQWLEFSVESNWEEVCL